MVNVGIWPKRESALANLRGQNQHNTSRSQMEILEKMKRDDSFDDEEEEIEKVGLNKSIFYHRIGLTPSAYRNDCCGK
jgi:hypothetical protein